MGGKIPSSRPGVPVSDVRLRLAGAGVPPEQVALLGIRGFFGKNQYGDYDDAVFLVWPTGLLACNYNTDPVYHRAGHGLSEDTHGMATLKPGLWSYQLGLHKGQYEALVQARDVIVYRDADSMEPSDKIKLVDGYKVYEDIGDFGIHIHHGGINGVSSIGCQTVPPAQWDEFITKVKNELKQAGQHVLPYLLIENPG